VTPLGRSLQNDQEWFPPRAPGGVAPESRETSRGTWVEEAKKCLPWALAYNCSASVLRAACCRTLQKPSLPRREGCVEQMEVNLTRSRKRRGRYSTVQTTGLEDPRCRDAAVSEAFDAPLTARGRVQQSACLATFSSSRTLTILHADCVRYPLGANSFPAKLNGANAEYFGHHQ
jgi:hypothetical protein